MKQITTKYLVIPSASVTAQMKSASRGQRVSPDGLTTILKYDGEAPQLLKTISAVNHAAVLDIISKWPEQKI